MLGVKIRVLQYISHHPPPGIVECELVDAHGRHWRFIEKVAVVDSGDLDEKSTYPRPGIFAAEVIQRRREPSGREIVRITTERPWGVESVDGVWEFDVSAETLVEFDG
jgi:hypothetical protein